jgi:antitoxin MazE
MKYMRTTIQKWGNSLALRIPKGFAQHANLENRSEVDIHLEDTQIVIKPVIREKQSLEDLLAGINKNNIHSEVETGSAEGKEIW